MKDEARWAAEKAARNTPLTVPCTYMETANPPGSTEEITTVFVKPFCALKEWNK